VRYQGDSGGRIGAFLSTSSAALLIQFVLQSSAGFYLQRAYIPDPKLAHGTMESILGASPHAIIAGFHYWGSAFFIVHSFTHLFIALMAGWFKPPNHWRWLTAVAFFGCAMLFQISGNLLPFDQHGVQTAAIEGGIAASIPGGAEVAKLIMGGEPAFNANTLSTWFFAHRILVPVALLLGILASIGSYSRRQYKTIWILSALIALIPLAIAFGVARPLGTAATSADYNRYDALVSWYTWPLHGSLEAFNRVGPDLGWIGTAVIPGLFALFLVSAPILSRRLASGGIQSIYILFLLYFGIVGVLFGGPFAPLTGTRDPATQSSQPTSEEVVDPIDAALAEVGRATFNAAPCSGCHGTDGLKPSGGPSLEKVHQQHKGHRWYIDFIRNPKSKKPSSTMPGFPNLPEKDIRAIAEFLRTPR
jgi:cytochrome c553